MAELQEKKALAYAKLFHQQSLFAAHQVSGSSGSCWISS
jgi:hypothetical protein